MKTSRILTLAGVGLAAVAFAAQDAITLQRTLAENSVDTYKIDSNVNQTIDSPNGQIPMNITTSMTMAIKTGKVDAQKGTADVEVTSTMDKMDADGPFGDMVKQQKIKPITQKGTIDKRGRMTLAAPTGSDLAQLAMTGSQATSSSIMLELPDHPVKIGDSWDVVIPKSIFTGPEDQNLSEKLVGEKNVDGHEAWVIDLSGTIRYVFDSSKLPTDAQTSSPVQGMKISVKGSVEMTGEGYVDKATGKTLSLDTTGKMKQNVEVGDGGISMDSAGPVTSKVKLQS